AFQSSRANPGLTDVSGLGCSVTTRTLRDEPPGGGLRHQRHRLLVGSRARVLGAELAPHVAAVDRLAEDGGLPERERLEPAERPDVPAAPYDIAPDELRFGREALERGDGRDAERARVPAGLGVRREQVAEVGARVADRPHLPVEYRLHPVWPTALDHQVAEAVIAVNDGVGKRLRPPLAAAAAPPRH